MGRFLALAMTLAACAAPSPSPSITPTANTWGPLAVIPPQDGADTARTEGTLRITDTCVLLETTAGDELLIWPADRTTWNEESREITFENFDGNVVTVRDGDEVILGGGGDSEAESGVSGTEWVGRIPWVSPPAESCPLDVRWGVGAIVSP